MLTTHYDIYTYQCYVQSTTQIWYITKSYGNTDEQIYTNGLNHRPDNCYNFSDNSRIGS